MRDKSFPRHNDGGTGGIRREPEPPASPMIAQFQALKAAHPDALLFFRMGDFYELFFDDAVTAAPALEIALTKRGRHGGEDIPMCGVPAANAELYLHRLIRKGFRVAVCEQLEDPAEARRRGGKPLVRRDVVRIVTPGTLTEDGLLEARRHNYLLAVAPPGRDGVLGLAWVDVSTGAFATQPSTPALLAGALAGLEPGEILAPARLLDLPPLVDLADGREGGGGPALTRQPDSAFDSQRAARRLPAAFGVAALEGFGEFTPPELAAAGALLDYLELTQKGTLPRLSPPRRVEPARVMQVDAATRRNLELTQALSGGREGSLLHAVDRTLSGAGARLLAERLAAPLTDPAAIDRRLDEVAALLAAAPLREQARGLLRRCPDLERALSRLALGRGGPRDLLCLAQALDRAAGLREGLAAEPALAATAARLEPPPELGGRLHATLADEPPHLARDGGLVRDGVHPELDALRGLKADGRRHIVALEERYRRETGIPSLKIRHNNQIGWYVEVTAAHEARIPAAAFTRRQGMAGAARFATAELSDLEARIATAGERALELELAVFEDLRAAALAEAGRLGVVALALAEADVAAGLAELAAERRYVRPLVDDSLAFAIEGGRHPVVEQALARANRPFVGNGCDLGPATPLWLLTGPNMAGKSTYLRQNALIALLAQAGSFVPATSARLGVVDRLFSRVGAADDLARGRSTFMVEMVEAAAILNLATERSLVILDEIGRGTSTYDGLSIAWAVVEHLHEANRCRALFATHYHELTALASRLPRLSCHTLKVQEWQGDVVFLHEVAPGTADRSYGVHVARLAGLPEAVLRRAEEVLRRLEAGDTRTTPARLAEDLPLFAALAPPTAPASSPAARPPAPPPPESEVERALRATNPDDLSPRQALDLLYRLRQGLLDRADT